MGRPIKEIYSSPNRKTKYVHTFSKRYEVGRKINEWPFGHSCQKNQRSIINGSLNALIESARVLRYDLRRLWCAFVAPVSSVNAVDSLTI